MVFWLTFFSKFTAMGTHIGTHSVNILIRVPEQVPEWVPASVKLLKIFQSTRTGTLLKLSQYMGTLNSVLPLGWSNEDKKKKKHQSLERLQTTASDRHACTLL